MEDDLLEEIVGAYRFHMRRQVVELLLDNPRGLRFSEIARALSIYPSTLEKHLAKLVRSRIISHHDGRYLSTMNTILIWEKFKNLQKIGSSPFLSSHILPIKNHDLRVRFGSLTFEVIFDLISIINQIRNDFNETQELIQAGGNLDYHIGRTVYGSGMLNHKNSRVEIVLTHQLINQIQNREEENLFLSGFDEEATRLYEIETCDLGLGVGESSGFLFLPRLDFQIDYNQCLYTKDPEAIRWLRDLFAHLKQQSQIFNP
ncbi:MAG: ArsR family transcriptional regulator [Candidatus Thorarchaeota archaeon]